MTRLHDHPRRGLGPSAARAPRRTRQRGLTLVIALVVLAVIALLAAWAARSSTANLRVVGNAQARSEALQAAQAAIESTISGPSFIQQPQAVAANPVPVDLDGDGTSDLTARIDPAPTCYRWRAVPQAELDPARDADRACMTSSAQSGGIEGGAGSAAGQSLCADSEWNVRAQVQDPARGTFVAVNQGVATRGFLTDIANACP